MINIKGLDKAELLVELYNHSHQQGLGMLHPLVNLTVEDAKKLLEEQTYFDYLYGKVMKVDLSNDEEFDEWLYDRDNGQGMAQSVVDGMRKKLEKTTTEVVAQGVNEYVSGLAYSIIKPPIDNIDKNKSERINTLNEIAKTEDYLEDIDINTKKHR